MNRFAQCVMLCVVLSLLPLGETSSAQSSPSGKNPGSEEEVLLAAVAREPANFQLLSSLGEYYLHEEKWQESIRWLTKASALSSGNE